MSKAADERRFARILFEEQLMISMFNWWRNPPENVCLPVIKALPKDATIHRVYPNFERQCFDAIVSSMEFERVFDGCVIPYFVTERQAVDAVSLKECFLTKTKDGK